MPGEYRNLSIKEVKVLYSLCKNKVRLWKLNNRSKNNEIRLVEDILLIYVKDINLLRNMNKEQLVEFMFNENEIVKSLSFVREFKDSIRNCVLILLVLMN